MFNLSSRLKAGVAISAVAVALTACAGNTGHNGDVSLLSGPPVKEIKTPYENALMCIRSHAPAHKMTVGVASIADRTGKYNYDTNGSGNFITQGGGDIMTSALWKTGAVNLVERLDTRVTEWELSMAQKRLLGDGTTSKVKTKDGSRSVAYRLIPEGGVEGSDAYVVGSINSLDFNIASGGAEVSVSGIGGKARAYRALVGMDLRLVDSKTSKIIASTSINKQIVGEDVGFGIGRFFGTTLVEVDVGEKRNEPLHLALRSMLQLGAYNLIKQAYGISACDSIIKNIEGVKDVKTSDNTPAVKKDIAATNDRV